MTNNNSKKIILIVLIVLLGLAVLVSAQNYSGIAGGRTAPSFYNIISGALGTIGAKGNTTNYNLTIITASAPVGIGNSSGYNVSLGYLYHIGKNINITNLFMGINKTANVKIFDVLNVSANATTDFELAFGWIIDNITGSNRNFTFSISGKNDTFSQNITVNISRDNVINFTAFVNDTDGKVTQSGSTLITVQNTPPPIPTLIAPNTNNNTINRTPTFVWSNVTDADNDSLLFNIVIECIGCSYDNRDVNVSALNFTPAGPLELLGDDGYYYNWSVRAVDNSSSGATEYGNFSDKNNITISGLVSIALPTGSVDFGSMILGQNDNTTDNSPVPIVIENDGNVFVNISTYSENGLWESVSHPSNKFQLKVDNITAELFSFNWSESLTSFTNVPAAQTLAIADLDYRDSNDSAEIDLHVDVPTGEPAGERTTNLTFQAKRSR
jgi:hypothetical protein